MESEQFTTVFVLATLGEPFEARQEDTTAECPRDAPPLVSSGSPGPGNPSGVALGVLLGFDPRGEPRVAGSHDRPLSARSIVPLTHADLGREAILAFEGGDPEKPIVLGLLQPQQTNQTDQAKPTREGAPSPVEVKLDGERLVVTSHKEIALRCGEASITLTRAGKVLIRGAHLVSRSSGMNRIQGGVVHIN